MDAYGRFLTQQAQEKYASAVELNDSECKHDPESEPFKSKYKAREIWVELKTAVDDYCHDDPTDDRWIFLSAGLDLKIGVNFTETEEVTSGEEHLNKCAEVLQEHYLNERACNVLQNALNQLGILWTGRRQPEKALDFLQRAQKLYKDFQHEVGGSPYAVDDLFVCGTSDDDGATAHRRSKNFESTYTHTLYYLAQVYGQLGESDQSAHHCQVTLRRQLETRSYHPVEWALNAATLSQFYTTTTKPDFSMARHCMASATVVLKEAGDETLPSENCDGPEDLPRIWASLNRCWVKYGLQLLEMSWDRLLDDGEGDDVDDKQEKSEQRERRDEDGASDDKKDTTLTFDLELTSVEEQITDKYVLDFEQARELFLVVQKWLCDAKEYYTIDDRCSDYTELVQDHSRLYKQLIFFEGDYDRQCKMHKRRIDMLNNVVDQLNPQYYLLVCRQLMFELAETYSAMLDLKVSMADESNGQPTGRALKKINTLTQQSIDEFNKYIDSLRNTDKELPEKLAEDDERPAMIAHFYIGRLYSKFVDFDVTKRITNLKKSVEHYKFVVDYTKRHPSAKEIVKAEHDICEEMVLLLPAKMDKILREAEQINN